MKDKKIKFIKTHVSLGQICGGALTIERKKGVELTLSAVGVMVNVGKMGDYLIPFTNITHISFESKDEA